MRDRETKARAKIKEVLTYIDGDVSFTKLDRLEDRLLILFTQEAPQYLELTKTKVKDKSLGWVEVYRPTKAGE